MNTQIYIEVYSILELLGKQYTNKIPKSLYNMIQNNVIDVNNLKYKSLKDINKDNIHKESLSMIALIHSNYWCESQEEKDNLESIFINNFVKNENEKREKFNPDNIFTKEDCIQETENINIIVYKEPLWKKVINKIKKLFYGSK